MTKCKVDRIDVGPNGIVIVCIKKPPGSPSFGNYHRTPIAPGVDPDAQMFVANQHLKSMGETEVQEGCIAKVRAACKKIHTPECCEKYRKAQAAFRI